MKSQGYRHDTMTKFFRSGIVQPVKIVLSNIQSGLTVEVTYYFEDLQHFYTCDNGVVTMYHKMGWKREPSRSEM